MKRIIRFAFFRIWLDPSSLSFPVFLCSLFSVPSNFDCKTNTFCNKIHLCDRVHARFTIVSEMLHWETIDQIGWFVSVTRVDIQIQISWIEQAKAWKWRSHLLAIIVVSSSIMRHFTQSCGFETNEFWLFTITFHTEPCQTMVTPDAYSLRNKISHMFDASFPTRHMHMIWMHNFSICMKCVLLLLNFLQEHV